MIQYFLKQVYAIVIFDAGLWCVIFEVGLRGIYSTYNVCLSMYSSSGDRAASLWYSCFNVLISEVLTNQKSKIIFNKSRHDIFNELRVVPLQLWRNDCKEVIMLIIPLMFKSHPGESLESVTLTLSSSILKTNSLTVLFFKACNDYRQNYCDHPNIKFLMFTSHTEC